MNNNRVIKFRIWDINLNMFLTIKENDSFNLYYFLNRPNDFVVQQFTGLRDRNDKEIFEGDIVNYISGVGSMIDGVGKGIIEFDEGCFGIDKYPLFNCYEGNLEIIGNIFETPDLLK